MATDAHQLLGRLLEFERALSRHRQVTAERFARMDRDFHRLQGTYRGKAAEEFTAHWRRTADAFRQYEEGARKMQAFLAERLEALRQAEETAF